VASPANETLNALVAQRFPVGSVVGSGDLREMLTAVGIEEPPLDVSTAVEAAIREWADESSQLAFQPGGWKVNVTGALAQSAISAALIWGVLTAAQLTTPIPVVLVSAIIPRLFSIERIKLSRVEDEVLATLALQGEARVGNAKALFDALPPEVREELNYSDFQALLDKLESAGRGERREDGSFVVYAKGRGKLRVKFE